LSQSRAATFTRLAVEVPRAGACFGILRAALGRGYWLSAKDVGMLRKRLLLVENAVEVGSKIVVGTPKNHKARSVPFSKFLA
jgi:hypothetical protein